LSAGGAGLAVVWQQQARPGFAGLEVVVSIRSWADHLIAV
jgi:hypothetical protein